MQHHAYLYEGSLSEFDAVKESIKPFVAQKHERFSIDDARELVAMAALKPAGDVTFLIGLSSITTEAQQALLKLLEEPQAGVHFVFLVPHGTLLPTVRSRMMVWEEKLKYGGQNSLVDVPGRGTTRGLFEQHISTFLKSSGKTRSDMIAVMLKDDEGVKERVLDFVNGLEAALAPTVKNPGVRAALEDIAKVRDYLRDRSPSLKMLLEHLALALPTL